MKILFIQKMAGISGSEFYYLNILPELKKRGVDVAFACVQHPADADKNKPFVEKLASAGVPCHIINSQRPVSWKLLGQLSQLILKEGFDLVQTNLIHADVWGALIKLLFNKKIKLFSLKHGYGKGGQKSYRFDGKPPKNNYYYLARFANRQMDHCGAISEGLANVMIRGGVVAKEKIDVIHYGFDFSGAKPAADFEKYRQSAHQLVIVGRLISVKQHHLVFEVLPDLLKEFPDLKLVLVGSGILEQELKAQVKALGIEHAVSFEGFRTNVHDYLAASDVSITPSSAEGFGIVILEAWHHKLPVIAFDVPAPNEIIRDGVDGYLLPPFNTDKLHEAIAHLLRNKEDARRMGEAGYQRLQQVFNMDVMIKRTLEVYQKVIGHSNVEPNKKN